MSDVTITRDGDHLVVTSPYDPAFAHRAKTQLNGKWGDGVWTFDARDESRVRDLLVDRFGTDGSDADQPTVDVRIVLPDVPSVYAEQEYRLAGRTLVRRPGRCPVTTAEAHLYFTYPDGRRSTIHRSGRRVVVTQADVVISDVTHPNLTVARAEYANWRCDPATDHPDPGDVISVCGFGHDPVVMMVTGVDTSTCPRHQIKIAGLRRSTGVGHGAPVTVTVTRHEFHYVTRLPCPPSHVPVPSVPTSGVPTMPSAVPIPVVPTVPTSGVPTVPNRPLPRPPRHPMVTWERHLADRARPQAATTNGRVDYAVRVETAPGSWAVLTEGTRWLAHVDQDSLDAFTRGLAHELRQPSAAVSVTAIHPQVGGRALLSAATAASSTRRPAQNRHAALLAK